MPVPVKPIVFAAAALLLVVALWYVFSPQASERPVPVASNPSQAKDIFDLEIKDGRLASGKSVIQVHRGEQVVLRFHYDDVGQFLGADPIDDPGQVAEHARYRDAALAAAVPFPEYWAAHPQYWRENWLRARS